MNDRYKFRIWDLKRKTIRQVWSITPFGVVVNDVKTESYKIPLDDCVIMQCTGLKDKNGKLIYEGDIIRQSDGCIGFIVWQDVSYWIESPGSHARDLEHTPYYESVEVVGNIYENPELREELYAKDKRA